MMELFVQYLLFLVGGEGRGGLQGFYFYIGTMLCCMKRFYQLHHQRLCTKQADAYLYFSYQRMVSPFHSQHDKAIKMATDRGMFLDALTMTCA